MAQHTAVLYIPIKREAFYKAGIEPLHIAVIRGSTTVPGKTFEEIQEATNGELEIINRPNAETVIITLPLNGKVTPGKLQKVLQDHGIKTIQCRATPKELEKIAHSELGSSLRTT